VFRLWGLLRVSRFRRKSVLGLKGSRKSANGSSS
jgi:hypothetical protein